MTLKTGSNSTAPRLQHRRPTPPAPPLQTVRQHWNLGEKIGTQEHPRTPHIILTTPIHLQYQLAVTITRGAPAHQEHRRLHNQGSPVMVILLITCLATLRRLAAMEAFQANPDLEIRLIMLGLVVEVEDLETMVSTLTTMVSTLTIMLVAPVLQDQQLEPLQGELKIQKTPNQVDHLGLLVLLVHLVIHPIT